MVFNISRAFLKLNFIYYFYGADTCSAVSCIGGALAVVDLCMVSKKDPCIIDFVASFRFFYLSGYCERALASVAIQYIKFKKYAKNIVFKNWIASLPLNLMTAFLNLASQFPVKTSRQLKKLVLGFGWR